MKTYVAGRLRSQHVAGAPFVVSTPFCQSLLRRVSQVAETPPGSVGPPVPFFVRRPDLTDISESLGRFPVEGLIAHFQRNERCYPKESKRCGRDKLLFLPNEKPAPQPPVEEAKPEPLAKGKKAPAGKAKGTNKRESEQIGASGEGGGDEARWQAIMGEVQSNRCLVLGAGESVSLATTPLFFSRQGEIQAKGRAYRDATAFADDGNVGSCCSGDLVPNKDSTDEEGVSGGLHDGDNATTSLQKVDDGADGGKGPRSMRAEYSSPFALCLDFRLELAKELQDDEESERQDATEKSADANGADEKHPADDKMVRIVACGNRVEVFAVLRLWAPAMRRNNSSGACDEVTNAGHSTEKSGSAAGAELAGGGVPGAGSRLPKDASAEKDDLGPRGSITPISPRSGGDCEDAPSTWHLSAILLRSGTSVLTAPCVDPGESLLARVRDPPEAYFASGRSEPSSRSGKRVCCDLAEWHSLAVVADPVKGEASLHIDGDEVAMERDSDSMSASAGGTSPEESELLAGGAVVVGGAGGEWATLALKNLAVYSKGLGGAQLRAITRVFRAWREEQEVTKASDAQEEERWQEETRKALEEGRAPGERATLKMSRRGNSDPCRLVSKLRQTATCGGKRKLSSADDKTPSTQKGTHVLSMRAKLVSPRP